MSSRELRLELPHLTLAAKAWGLSHEDILAGRVSGRIAVALHGWLDNAASFDQLAPLLPEDVAFLALDIPGHGLSGRHPAGASIYFLDHVGVLIQALEALGICIARAGSDDPGGPPVVLIGHSMGAGISTLAAGTYPEVFSHVVLIDGMGPLSDEDERAPERLRNFIEHQDGLRESSTYPDVESAVRARKRVGGISEDSARRLVERNIVRSLEDTGFVWRTDPRLKLPSPVRLTERQVVAFLAAITAPVLLVLAEDSQFRGYEQLIAKRLEFVKAPVEIVKLTGGHHLHLENAEPVAQAVAEFLG